jgi:hypothetical protein
LTSHKRGGQKKCSSIAAENFCQDFEAHITAGKVTARKIMNGGPTA